MKTIHILLSAIMLFALSFNASSKGPVNEKTANIHVAGNCEICKARIEKASKAAGATTADWNAEKQMLKVSFDAKTTSEEKISKAIAAVGHDAGEFKADNKIYNALPSCCKYERKK